jgi:hypothetical protein
MAYRGRMALERTKKRTYILERTSCTYTLDVLTRCKYYDVLTRSVDTLTCNRLIKVRISTEFNKNIILSPDI